MRLDKVPIILKQRGVPSHLINRLVVAVLRTRISLVWYNQKTQYYDKTRGIKEGCPVSPQIFNQVIDEIVQTLKEILQEIYHIDLEIFENGTHSIRAPMLMAYADDIVIITEDLPTLDRVFGELQDLLSTMDLKLNESKTKLLIRDPEPFEQQSHYTLAGINIERVENIKYLGSKLISNTDRPASIRERSYSAVTLYKKLEPYLQSLKAPFSLLKLIYTTVLMPVMTYGLNVMSMTKANRRSLARKEILIVHGLASIACPPPEEKTVKKLMHGRTINRRITAQRIRYYGHILRRPRDSVLRRALRLRVRKRRHGRPLITWNDSLQSDFQQYTYNSSDWEAQSSDKQQIKRMTETIYQEQLVEEFDYLNDPETIIHSNLNEQDSPEISDRSTNSQLLQ